MSGTQVSVPGALEWYLAQHRQPNEAMYHYTSRQALENILIKRRMWATDLRMMNDPKELRYGRSLIEDRVRRAALRSHNPLRKKWLRAVYQQFLKHMADNSSSFAISLSEHPDLTSQWKNYGDNGRGFALGWSIDSNYFPMPLQTWVSYDRAEQKALIDGLISFHLDYLGMAVNSGRQSPDDAWTSTGLSLGMFLNIVQQTFKHHRWAPEAEFRYVYQYFHGYEPADTYKTRVAGGVTKRYVEADFAAADLLYVVTGPRNDPATTMIWLRTLLDRNGFASTKIVRSAVSPTDFAP